MKSSKILLGAALVLASLVAQQAVAAIAFNATTASIRNSKHDLSFSSTATVRALSTAAAADEVCVFCHTPHGGDYAKGPLWNRGGVPALTNPYANGDTMDSAVLAAFATSSAACMTCHDGVIALDNLINASGSGGYTASGTTRLYGNAGGTISMGQIAAGVTRIGADLRDDHPIGVAYCGGFTVAAGCVDGDFVLATNSGQTVAALVKNGTAGSGAAVNSGAATDKYWIDTDGTTATRSKQDLTLFVRAFTQTVNSGNQPSVECASCHDVHNSGNGTFLRVANLKSALCFACHIK